MRILIVNNRLRRRSGTEIVTRDLACGLLSEGNDVAVLTERTGPIAAEVRIRGGAVCEDVASIPWLPDIIHANHPDVAAPAFVRFPTVPAIAVCHNSDEPFVSARYPSIRVAFGVSNACRDRASRDLHFPLEDVGLLLNAVDLDHCPWRDGLPARPAKWLFVAEKESSRPMLRLVRKLARRLDATVSAVGPRVRYTVRSLATYAAGFDLVIASARSALETAATGTAVCVADPRGIGGMLTRESWSEWRDENLGKAILKLSVTQEHLERSIRTYDASEARLVAAQIRSEAALSTKIRQLVEIYDKIIDQSSAGAALPTPNQPDPK